jgi:hypothetical protein
VRNRAPEPLAVHIEPAGAIMGGDDIVVRPQARDVDGDTIRFSYRWTVNGVPIEARESVLSTRELARGDSVRLTVVASDGDEQSEPIRTPELKITNGTPRITSQPAAPKDDGSFVYDVKAEDPDRDTLRFVLDKSPAGMEIDPVSGQISWKPAPDLVGDFPVRVRVEDMHGGKDEQEFSLTLSTEDAPPPQPAAPAE